MIVTSGSLDKLFTGFNARFNQAFEGVTPHWPEIAMEVSSEDREETYGWLGQFPRLREWLGDRVVNSLALHGYTIKNRKFESTIEVDRDDIADDRIGVFAPIVAEMGRASRTHPDELVFELLKAGFTTLAYDGQYFFDTDHEVADENGAPTLVSNMQAGGGPAWFLIDASRAIRPMVFQIREPYRPQQLAAENEERVFMKDSYLYGVRARANAGFGLWQMAFGSKADLIDANYEAARASMMNLRGEAGRKLGVMPTHLFVGPSLEKKGRSLIVAQELVGGGTNVWQNSVKLVVTPLLD